MGGGGGYNPPILSDDQKQLVRQEAEAKQELARAKAARRSLFISFAAEDIDEVNLLRGQAKNEKSDMEFVDRSVRDPFDSNRADYIKQRISERIRQSSMTVVMLTSDSAKSQWVNWEIERSLELGKKVVAFHTSDKPPGQLPRAVKDHAIKVVSWSDLSEEVKPKD